MYIMYMPDQQIFEEVCSAFNLSSNGRQMYLTLFKQGEQSVGKLAENLNMDRSSAYLAADNLKTAGLIEIDESRRPKTVRAIEPRQLLGRLERKIQDIEEVFDRVHTNIANLETIYKLADQRPLLQSFSGKEGLHHIVEDILNFRGGEIMLFTNPLAEKQVFTNHDHNYFIRRRRQENLVIRVIATESAESLRLQVADRDNLRETKILKGTPLFDNELYIYGNSVAMLSFKNDILGFIINSPDFSGMLRWQFEKMWEEL